MLVGGLEPGCGVDGVAISGVVEKAAAAEIADQRRPGMDTDPGGAEIDALRLPSFAQNACAQASRSWAQATARVA